jgi:DNA primase
MANEDIQELLESVDMEMWLDREGVDYRVTRGSRGIQLNVRECPVCGTAKWKVYLNQDNGLGNCFSGDCEAKFNKWSFIKAQLGTPQTGQLIEHLKQVAKEQGWRPVRKVELAVNMATELKMPESIALPHNGRNLKYLDNRNINANLTSYFHLRFCHRGHFDYLDVEGRPRKQDYSNRVIIPIFDLNGDLVSYQGRDITGTADRKYLFPPGFASTGSIIFNGHNAHGAEDIVIGEGAFDVMATKFALDGQPELRRVVAVGSFGKHLSHGDENSQLAKLMKLRDGGLKRVTFMWDGEDRAIQDAVEAALMVRRFGLTARIAVLPKDKDPNEVAPQVVRDAFWKAVVVDDKVAIRMKLARRAT